MKSASAISNERINLCSSNVKMSLYQEHDALALVFMELSNETI